MLWTSVPRGDAPSRMRPRPFFENDQLIMIKRHIHSKWGCHFIAVRFTGDFSKLLVMEALIN
jgi:hypothetical protein